MDCYFDEQQQQLNLGRNDNIIKAEISSMFHDEDIDELFLAMPNIETLVTDTLMSEMAQSAAANLQRLKEIVCNNMLTSCRKSYKQFLSDNPDFNQNIKVVIVSELDTAKNWFFGIDLNLRDTLHHPTFHHDQLIIYITTKRFTFHNLLNFLNFDNLNS